VSRRDCRAGFLQGFVATGAEHQGGSFGSQLFGHGAAQAFAGGSYQGNFSF
jgi:hypothetical protein